MEYLTVAEVAKTLGLSVHQVYRRIHRGDITAVTSRKGYVQFLISVKELEAYQACGSTEVSEPRPAPSAFLTTTQAALLTGFSPETIRALIRANRITGFRGKGPRGHYRISRDSINAFTKDFGKIDLDSVIRDGQDLLRDTD